MRKGRDGEKKLGEKKEKTDGNSGYYVIASSRPPERRPLERRLLVPIPLIIKFTSQHILWAIVVVLMLSGGLVWI